MAIVVAILDHDHWQANADIIVIVDDQHKQLTWVPRDLYWPRLGQRINRAFSVGGCELLREGLMELGFPCTGAICFRRGATENMLRDISVKVTVLEPLAFWYPLKPEFALEEGRKLVVFLPPSENLSGERLHQWIGARTMTNGRNSDLHRLERQQILLRALLAERFDFRTMFLDRTRVKTLGRNLRRVLLLIDCQWKMRTFKAVRYELINEKPVLTRLYGLALFRTRISHTPRVFRAYLQRINRKLGLVHDQQTRKKIAPQDRL